MPAVVMKWSPCEKVASAEGHLLALDVWVQELLQDTALGRRVFEVLGEKG